MVSSQDGFDEFSASGETHVVEVDSGSLRSYTVTPEDVGLERAADGAVGAGTPDENAEVLRSVLDGAQGTERSLTVMNAGAAIYAAGAAPDLDTGARRAEEAIDSGAAAEVLKRFVERTNR